jgi:hypothetical protein
MQSGCDARAAGSIGLIGTENAPTRAKRAEPQVVPEIAVAFTAAVLVALALVPYDLKQGQDWYTAAHSVVLASTVASLSFLFAGNTHTKIIQFQMASGFFWQVVVLSLVDWVRVMAMPDPGWELTDRLAGTASTLARLAFFCADALKAQSRWFRLFIAFLFFLGNLYGVIQAYFLDPAIPIYTVKETNTTFTTSGVRASVGTTMISLTLNMIVTIWKDTEFDYCALCTSFLPKKVLDGVRDDQTAAAAQAEDAAAWRGRPRKGAVVLLTSIVIFVMYSWLDSFTAGL